jgi:hypothetical protein
MLALPAPPAGDPVYCRQQVRMTGCPNGCARPYMAELGLVADGANSYQIWLGGCPAQTRLAETYADRVKMQVRRSAARLVEPAFLSFDSMLRPPCRGCSRGAQVLLQSCLSCPPAPSMQSPLLELNSA